MEKGAAHRRPHGRRRGVKNGGDGDRPYRNKVSPEWMRGVKGCSVCGQDHRANTRNYRNEVTATVKKLKDRNPQALVTVDELADVVNMVCMTSDEDDHRCKNEVQSVE